MAHVFFKDHVILAAYRCIEKHKLNFDCKLSGIHYLFWSLSLWIHCVLAVFSRSFCVGIVIAVFCPSVSKRMELNWKQRQGKKYRKYSCLYMSVVAVASPLSLVAVSSSLGKAMFSLLRGFLLLSSFLFLELNFNVASEEFSPARISIHFLNPELLCLLLWSFVLKKFVRYSPIVEKFISQTRNETQ